MDQKTFDRIGLKWLAGLGVLSATLGCGPSSSTHGATLQPSPASTELSGQAIDMHRGYGHFEGDYRQRRIVKPDLAACEHAYQHVSALHRHSTLSKGDLTSTLCETNGGVPLMKWECDGDYSCLRLVPDVQGERLEWLPMHYGRIATAGPL